MERENGRERGMNTSPETNDRFFSLKIFKENVCVSSVLVSAEHNWENQVCFSPSKALVWQCSGKMFRMRFPGTLKCFWVALQMLLGSPQRACS